MEIFETIIYKYKLIKSRVFDFVYLFFDKIVNKGNKVEYSNIKNKAFRYKKRKLKIGRTSFILRWGGIKFRHTKKPSDEIWDFGKKVLKINDETKQLNFNKKLAIFIVTANHPKEVNKYLYALGQTFTDLNIDCHVLDSSDDDLTKAVVDKWITKLTKKNGNQCIFYDRYDEEPVGDSLDKKVMYAFKKYRNQYEYFWPIRDRSGILFNYCAKELYETLNNKKPDLMMVYEKARERRDNDDTEYTDCAKLFKDHYNLLTALQHWILKSSFANDIIDKIPLDKTTYSLYYPTAMFHYISTRPFLACCLVKEYIFKYSPAVKKFSHWNKFFFKQWFDYFYNCLINLPDVYKPLLPEVLREFSKRYPIFSIGYLITLKIHFGIDKVDIDKYKKGIELVSITPLELYYEISNLKIKKPANNIQERKLVKKIYEKLKTDKKNNKIGIIDKEAVGE